MYSRFNPILVSADSVSDRWSISVRFVLIIGITILKILIN
jgi:hypothetical protein